MLDKNSLIDLVYSKNGETLEQVYDVYDFEDGEYRLVVQSINFLWKIEVREIAKHRCVARAEFEKFKDDCDFTTKKFKISKKGAKEVADLVFTLWNIRN